MLERSRFVDWCTTVVAAPAAKVKSASAGQPWSGAGDENVFGKFDPQERWRGWLTVLSAVTPTAGRLVLFGDMGTHLYALDADSGKELWSTKLDGALGGGIVSYRAGGKQRIAVVSGTNSPIWPVPEVTAKTPCSGSTRLGAPGDRR